MGFLDKFRKKPKTSPGGSPIYRYEVPEDHGLRVPQAFGTYAEEIAGHFEALFPGRESFVFHELISDLVHIDVNIMRPTEEDNYYVLYTTGMSDLPMTLPEEIEDAENWQYAELYLLLPGDWHFGQTGDLDKDLPESSYWPIRMLKFLARFPHEYQTWLGWGHTMPNGPDYTPMSDGVGFGGVVLTQPSGVTPLETQDGKRISFYLVVPAYREEIEYKLKYGMEELSRRLVERGMSLVLDPQRPNCCGDFTEILDGPEEG